MGTTETTADLQAITELYEEYGRTFDQGLPDDFADLFSPDGTFILPDGHKLAGREQLRRLAQRAAEGKARRHHFVRNLTVKLSGDRASGTAHVVAVAVMDTEVSLLVAGVYRDELVRLDGRWRFDARKVTDLSPESLPELSGPG